MDCFNNDQIAIKKRNLEQEKEFDKTLKTKIDLKKELGDEIIGKEKLHEIRKREAHRKIIEEQIKSNRLQKLKDNLRIHNEEKQIFVGKVHMINKIVNSSYIKP